MASSSPSLRYPRIARLLLPADFSALRNAGKRLSCRYFYCEYRLTSAATARLGMAVSRRVSKRAVERNRIRRQIRESFRLQRARLLGCDVLVVARTLATEQANCLLRDELNLLWSRLSMLNSVAQNEARTTPAALNDAGLTGTMRHRS